VISVIFIFSSCYVVEIFVRIQPDRQQPASRVSAIMTGGIDHHFQSQSPGNDRTNPAQLRILGAPFQEQSTTRQHEHGTLVVETAASVLNYTNSECYVPAGLPASFVLTDSTRRPFFSEPLTPAWISRWQLGQIAATATG
jgi:hypothetical protein